MGTREGGKKGGVPDTWEGSQEKDLGTKVGLFFPNTPSPQSSKTMQKDPLKKEHKRLAEKPGTGVRKKEMSDSLKSHYDE